MRALFLIFVTAAACTPDLDQLRGTKIVPAPDDGSAQTDSPGVSSDSSIDDVGGPADAPSLPADVPQAPADAALSPDTGAPLRALGDGCVNDGQCASGACAMGAMGGAGICCDRPCDPRCGSCTTGTCKSMPERTPCGTRSCAVDAKGYTSVTFQACMAGTCTKVTYSCNDGVTCLRDGSYSTPAGGGCTNDGYCRDACAAFGGPYCGPGSTTPCPTGFSCREGDKTCTPK